jgi:hypothetical protein
MSSKLSLICNLPNYLAFLSLLQILEASRTSLFQLNRKWQVCWDLVLDIFNAASTFIIDWPCSGPFPFLDSLA